MMGDPSSLDALRYEQERRAKLRMMSATLTFRRVFRPRIWLGMILLRIALRIMGASMETQ